MGLSLANKYRSRDFTDLIGQDHISHILHYQAMHGIRQTNYLFCGPRGTGKTSTARIFAKALNCLDLHDGNPCHVCANCQMIDRNETMDIIEIDAASHTGVDNIREEIIDKAGYRPTVLKKKVYIIDEVHMLSKGAFNALLKTMEEPREYMVFILATTELSKVPETIVSRCQVFNFKKIDAGQIIQRLHYIATAESINTTDEGLAMIAQLSDGCMRDAVKYLDQISSMGEVTAEHVAQFLGVVSESVMQDLVTLLRRRYDDADAGAFTTIVTMLTQLTTNGIDLTLLPKQLMAYIDDHFAHDQSFYAALTTMVAGLMRDARRYPHPLLLYKTSIWLWKRAEGLKGGNAERGLKEGGKAKEEIGALRHPEGNGTQGNEIEGSPTMKDLSIESSFPVRELLPKEAKELREGSSIQNTPSTPPLKESTVEEISADAFPLREGGRESHIDTKEGEESPSEQDDLTSSFIALIPTGSLKTMLTGQCEIESIVDGVVRLIVLNPLAKLPLSKKETQESLLAQIRTLTDQSVDALQIIQMTKEEYVMR